MKTGRGIGGRKLIYPVADVSDEAICLRPDHPCDAQPETYKSAAIYAMTHGQTLNSFIDECVVKQLDALHL